MVDDPKKSAATGALSIMFESTLNGLQYCLGSPEPYSKYAGRPHAGHGGDSANVHRRFATSSCSEVALVRYQAGLR